jgi:ribonucleoside-diphosphate reductase alpha chain
MEQPLPPYGACLLGSVNLTKMVLKPFTDDAAISDHDLETTVRAAVQMLDAVIDISNFPIPQQKEEAKAKRRMGIGITGLADALFMMGVSYGSQKAVKITEQIMKTLTIAAYDESIKLAKLFGPCPVTQTMEQRQKFIISGFMQKMPDHIKDGIMANGIRNSHLMSIAPTGTISLYAGNISSGIEPIFAPSYTRKVLNKDGTKREERVEDYAVKAYREFREFNGYDADPHPRMLVTAQDLDPIEHLKMQAAAQIWVDSSISKTINCPVDIPFGQFEDVYMEAWKQGCKGCTTYRPNDVTGSVLSVEPESKKDESPSLPSEPVTTHGLIPRDKSLFGQTYKLKWQDSNFYVTINNHYDSEGKSIPFEIFINTQNMSHFQWTVALTRMMSSVFRRGGDISFVIEDLKSIIDPNGGAWVDGKYIPSFIALLGSTLEGHLRDLKVVNKVYDNFVVENYPTQPVERPMQCPSCKGFNVHLSGGCPVCADCGHSKCG